MCVKLISHKYGICLEKLSERIWSRCDQNTIWKWNSIDWNKKFMSSAKYHPHIETTYIRVPHTWSLMDVSCEILIALASPHPNIFWGFIVLMFKFRSRNSFNELDIRAYCIRIHHNKECILRAISIANRILNPQGTWMTSDLKFASRMMNTIIIKQFDFIFNICAGAYHKSFSSIIRPAPRLSYILTDCWWE